MIKFYFFLFLCFFSYSNSKEDLKELNKKIENLQIEMFELRKDHSTHWLLIEQLDKSFKENQRQMDHLTRENTELRKDIRALNQDMHTLQNKKPKTSTLNKAVMISVMIVCLVIAFVLFRFYYQMFS